MTVFALPENCTYSFCGNIADACGWYLVSSHLAVSVSDVLMNGVMFTCSVNKFSFMTEFMDFSLKPVL